VTHTYKNIEIKAKKKNKCKKDINKKGK